MSPEDCIIALRQWRRGSKAKTRPTDARQAAREFRGLLALRRQWRWALREDFGVLVGRRRPWPTQDEPLAGGVRIYPRRPRRLSSTDEWLNMYSLLWWWVALDWSLATSWRAFTRARASGRGMTASVLAAAASGMNALPEQVLDGFVKFVRKSRGDAPIELDLMEGSPASKITLEGAVSVVASWVTSGMSTKYLPGLQGMSLLEWAEGECVPVVHDVGGGIGAVGGLMKSRANRQFRERPEDPLNPDASDQIGTPEAEFGLHHGVLRRRFQEGRERETALHRAARLGPQETRVMELTADGWEEHEIAEHLGIAPGTVAATKNHARRKLKEVLSG